VDKNQPDRGKTMDILKKTVCPIVLASLWIALSEFFRNQYLFFSYWSEHYKKYGLIFPSDPVNGAVWGLWSLLFSVFIYIILKKFSLLQTTLLAWFVGFVLMWLVIWNLNVLPNGLLYFAVPLSLLEVFVAAFIIKKISSRSEK